MMIGYFNFKIVIYKKYRLYVNDKRKCDRILHLNESKIIKKHARIFI